MIAIRWFVLLIAILLLGGWQSSSAQSEDIVLTLTLAEGMEYLDAAGVFDIFEEDHPGVHVHIKYLAFDDFVLRSRLTTYLPNMDAYTLTGDVLYTSIGAFYSSPITPLATRAGYLLDLAPLIQTDPDFDPSVFYPALWESAQWDGGVWMLPSAAQPYALFYNAGAFDQANLTYPTEDWQIENFAHAIADVTPGGIQAPLNSGFIGYNSSDRALAYTLIGSGLYDTSVVPNPPDLNQPEAVTFIERWSELYASGAVYNPDFEYLDFEVSEIPFIVDGFTLAMFSDNPAALLPGGKLGVQMLGFAISSRTQHPEESYELLKFLSDDQRIADGMKVSHAFATLARPLYVEVDPIENAPYGGGKLSPEEELLLQRGLENAVPYSEIRYYDALFNAVILMTTNRLDAETALLEAQAQLERELLYAESLRATLSGVVAPPPPEVVLAPGEISLSFRLVDGRSFPNRDAWEVFMTDFTEADAEIGQTIFDTQSAGIEATTEDYDCFYTYTNVVSSINPKLIISLDPLLSADSTFNSTELLSGVLDQVSRDNAVMAYPLDVRPLVIWFDPQMLETANITVPEGGWTAESFFTTLQQIHETTGEPVMTSLQSSNMLLMLIAAAGGLPVDYRTDPPQLHYTTIETQTSIQQVLDLAKAGVIFYEPLTSFSVRSGGGDALFFAHNFVLDGWHRAGFQATHFPGGTQFTPTVFDVGAVYISANSRYPEACYRLIRAIAQRPDLLAGMPVNAAQVESSTMSAVQGMRPFYDEFATHLNNPDRVILPSVNSALLGDFVAQYWLLRAFDRYVLENADLETELADAEILTLAYFDCVAALPPFDAETQQMRSYYYELTNCAIQVDPTSTAYFRVNSP